MEKVKSLKVNTLNNITKLYHKLAGIIKLPKFHHFPRYNLKSIKRTILILFANKFLFIGSISVITVIVFIGTTICRAYILYNSRTVQKATKDQTYNFTPSMEPSPTLQSTSPSVDPSPSDNSVLGTSDDSSSNDAGSTDTLPTPTPYPTPLPTDIPDTTTTTTNTSSTTSNSSENSNCTTDAGVPNSWYSDVYPDPPISTNTGSKQLEVDIRDCNQNLISVTNTITISLNSTDSTAQFDTTSTTTQNGKAYFTVSSQNTGIDTYTITDTTSSFTVTDNTNHNPSVTFNSSSTTTPTPTQTTTQSPSQTPNTTPSQTPTATLTGTP